jgi:hypothetical protein
METALFLLAILSVFILISYGYITVVKTIRGQAVRVIETMISAAPITYLVWFFLLRGR